ncbi:hypothetical protein [Saccharopolyspora endophytica]|uniref:Uncharacterized protein n=1 Tax=Saccharopolyspora endophytica TaxID=543886 RepID=A0ABS5DQK8_9PSEU|nr:hypothetical protein [Saccharopolyspora endophytica]MBQ0928613.1 hypothetical protein [Saccharopolyspora endophytica]
MPTELERRIAAQISCLKVPSNTLPPHDDEPRWWRMTRIAMWPAAIRLAMLAGQWQLPDHIDGPVPETDVQLDSFLAGLYPPGEIIERWLQIVNRQPWDLTEREADQWLEERIPNCDEGLAVVERTYFSISPTFSAIATGDVSD